MLGVILKVLDIHPLPLLEPQGPAAEAYQGLACFDQGPASAFGRQQEREPAQEDLCDNGQQLELDTPLPVWSCLLTQVAAQESSALASIAENNKLHTGREQSVHYVHGKAKQYSQTLMDAPTDDPDRRYTQQATCELEGQSERDEEGQPGILQQRLLLATQRAILIFPVERVI